MPVSGKTRARLGALGEARVKWDHVRSLVEQATSRHSMELMLGRAERSIGGTLKRIDRASRDVAELLVAHGFVRVSDDVREISQLARKGETIHRVALGRMKEVVVVVAQNLDLEELEIRRAELESADGEPE
jgi:hypothetical protein